MNKRGLLILLALTVAAVAALVIVQRPEPAAAPAQALIFPQLRDELGRVAEIELLRAGGRSVTLVAGEAGWGVAERAGYPADTGRVRQLLLGLAALRSIEAKTKDPKNYHYLGVQDLDQPDAAGTLVRVVDAGGQPLAALILGGAAADGVYVRRADQAQSYLASGVPPVQVEPGRWLSRELVSVPAEEIVRVEADAGYRLAREDGRLVLAAPIGSSLRNLTRAEQLFALLADLSPLDVRPAAEIELKEAGRLSFQTAEGLRVILRHALVDGALLSRWQVEATATADVQTTARAEALNARLAPWVYELPDYLNKRLNLSLEALTQPPGA